MKESPARINSKYLIFAGVLALLLILSIILRNLDLSIRKLPLGEYVELVMNWAVVYLYPGLEVIKVAVSRILVTIEIIFLWIPWLVWIIGIGILGWKFISLRTGLLLMAALLFVQAVDLWAEAMSTVSLVSVALVLSILIAIPIGIISTRSKTLESILRPVLDAMQTTPTLVYLIPAVMLLGVGKVPAIITTMIFAVPPTIRFTNLGLRQVSKEVKEAAAAFGASKWQILTKVEIPLALKTIMAGINQSTLMAVSMVVVAAFIGAGGLGYSVLFALDRVRIGSGFEAGLAILAIAIVFDRLTQALGKPKKPAKQI